MVSLFPIRLKNANVRKRGKSILGPLSFEMEGGGPTIIIGPNGAGKTTFLRLLHGLEKLREDELKFNALSKEEAQKMQSFVFQKPILLRRSTLDNVAYPLLLHGKKKNNARKLAYQMLTKVGLDHLAEVRAVFLSGGEAQKLSLARALITGPKLLLLDEPTASLDSVSTRDIEALINEASENGIEIIMTTHHLGQAKRLAKKVIFFNQGQVVESAKAHAFWQSPKSKEAQRFINGDIV